MRAFSEIVENNKSLISVLELKRLLIDIKSKRPDICFRFRLLGEMWAPQAMRVVQVTDRGVILNDEITDKVVNIPDLSSIIQFELDAPFQGFQPHYHYQLQTRSDFN
jgi:hypothetical protein